MRRMGIAGGDGAAARRGTRRGRRRVPAIAGTGVKAVRVAANLASPVGFTFTPRDGSSTSSGTRAWCASCNLQTGVDRRCSTGSRASTATVNAGALGVALHPDWPTQPVRLRLRHEEHRPTAPQPGPADQGAERPRRGASGAPVGRRRPREQPQRRPDRVRTRRQALRGDRRRRTTPRTPRTGPTTCAARSSG